MRIALVEHDIHWQDVHKNLYTLTASLSSLDCQLIILPEMFSSGFTMNPKSVTEDNEALALPWMKKLASDIKSAVCGSLAWQSHGQFFNRFFFVFPDSSFKVYDKRHLFTFAGEHKTYTPGLQHLVVEYLGFSIQPFVCYDLRFPIWCRNVHDVDLQIYVANWPSVRKHAWKSLLVARAIENQCFLAGVNRIGKDGNGHDYSGGSTLLDPIGQVIADEIMHFPWGKVILTEIEKETRLEVKRKYQFLEDRPLFDLK